ncbi:MAG: response regulator transcription factor [Acidobacteria bacterium]|nr:response regulator transcription factor [Acidobacteriota bacterium]
MTRRILIVDDEQDILALLRYNLQREGYEVQAAIDGRQAIEQARGLPDLILLDILMPEMDGFEVARRLKQGSTTSRIPVLFLTARAGEIDEVVGLELGAEDYIVKPVSMPKLLARIRAVFRRLEGPPVIGSGVIRLGPIEIDTASYVVRVDAHEVPFTKKEFDLLAQLASRSGSVLTREALLDSVWGNDIHIIDRTVDVHIRRIREKLGKHADIIETVKGVGYRARS